MNPIALTLIALGAWLLLCAVGVHWLDSQPLLRDGCPTYADACTTDDDCARRFPDCME